MTTIVDQADVLAGLVDVWNRLDELLAGLSDDEWARPTPLPGWNVKDVVAHMIGTESMLLGDATPSVDAGAAPHVRNDIGRVNEVWVVSMADLPPADVLATFRGHTARRLESLRAMDAAAWDAEGFTPAGNDTYGRFMRIRVFDCWLHEQDIRDGVGRPGGEVGTSVELALDEAASVMGFVVGKRAAAPPGSRVAFDLTGPTARRIFVEVGNEERPRHRGRRAVGAANRCAVDADRRLRATGRRPHRSVDGPRPDRPRRRPRVGRATDRQPRLHDLTHPSV